MRLSASNKSVRLRRCTRRLAFFVLLPGLLLTLWSCAAGRVDERFWVGPADELLWPEPPAAARVKYLRSIAGPDDFLSDSRRAGLLDWLLGRDQEVLPLLTPYDVASDAEHRVWVSDNGARLLYLFDLAQRELIYIRQINGEDLVLPTGLAYDMVRQRLYLADSSLGKVFVLDPDGGYLGELKAPQGMQRPGGVAVDRQGRVHVADALAGMVLVFASDGQYVGQITSKISPSGRFARPLDVAFGPSGETLVLDGLGFSVEVQGEDGSLLGQIGKIGDSPGAFARPRGIVVDRTGLVYVSDAAFDNIQVFDLAGRYLFHFGVAGTRGGEFNLPAGLCVDPLDRLYIADAYNHRVQVMQLLALGP